MPRLKQGSYSLPADLNLGLVVNSRVPEADQKRQRVETVEILRRLCSQPGVILADEVGMGKTFVALAVAYSVAIQSPRGPVIVMVPAHLIGKWEQDLTVFCELYLTDRHPVRRDSTAPRGKGDPRPFRYGVARTSVELMKLLDDRPGDRCHLVFVAQGAMGRRQSDKWVRLALIAEALRRHGRGNARRLIQVKEQVHRFLARLLWAVGEERSHDWGDELWQRLIRTSPSSWKDIYNDAVRREERRLPDDPVPKSVVRALERIDLKPLAVALEAMPVRARGSDDRLNERIDDVRPVLREVESELWRELLVHARWRSPLLVMDEAHHLKNPGTRLARQLQSADTETDLRTGDGAMAGAFDRMLFLTATPFQLGHQELVRVLERFGDVKWCDAELGAREAFVERMRELGNHLNESQSAAIALQRSWERLRPEDADEDVEAWWAAICAADRDELSSRQRAVVHAYGAAKQRRDAAENALRPWVVRHNKGAQWTGTGIRRRARVEGGAVAGAGDAAGLRIPPQQLLPFFLAARSAVKPGQDLLGEALCSSYEAFRFTRRERLDGRDDQEDDLTEQLASDGGDLAHASWYLEEFDRALRRCSGAAHPKVSATVQKVVDLWETGEKVLVFAFYRHTCRALRIHISREIDRRLLRGARGPFLGAGREVGDEEIERLLAVVQRRFFDDDDTPARRAVDAALGAILADRASALDRAAIPRDQRELLTDIMRRFLRVRTTLARCFPLVELETIDPADAIRRTLDHMDGSGLSWREKFTGFLDYLTDQCSVGERGPFLEAASRTQTGGIRVEGDDDAQEAKVSTVALANVQVATGETRRDHRERLMRAFNTPFFPDILVCSEVMGEGVDLQRFCRHVVHHDLAWNPSTLEQRTGRIDRLGCKAEGRHRSTSIFPSSPVPPTSDSSAS